MIGKKMNFKNKIFMPVILLAVLIVSVFAPATGEVRAEDAFVEVDIPAFVIYNQGDGPEETFELKIESLDGTELDGETVKYVTGTGQTSFGTYRFSRPGIYSFKVTQTIADTPDVEYDPACYKVDVYVENTAGGGLKAVLVGEEQLSGRKIGDGKPEKVLFNNEYVYAPKKTFTGTFPPILKKLVGDAPEKNRFVFTLTRDDHSYPMPETAPAEVDSVSYTIRDVVTEGSAEIGKITFSEAGTYSYTVTETDLGEDGYTYDASQYKITYNVTKTEKGDLEATVKVLKDEASADTDYLVFTNEYEKTTEEKRCITVDPPVKKIIDGNPTGRTDFTFKMVADDPGFPMPEGSVDGVKKVAINNEGEADFGRYDYTEAGVYSYKVYEEQEGKDGYTYDTIVYYVTDTVTSDENGSLSLSRLVTTSTGDEYKDVSYNDFIYTFVNKYNSGTVPTPDNPPSEKKTQGNVNTGDSGANALKYSIIAAAAASAGIIFMIVLVKKKKRN